MKLKQQSSDFIVEELPDIKITEEQDEHSVFLLEKQGIDTFDAIRLVARKLGISLFEIGYAGLKDKHALARQYISVPARLKPKEMVTEGLRTTFVGYTRKKIKIGDLRGNRFSITVRDIRENELAAIAERASTVPVYGVPNYFDSQRFGSVIHGEFIGKHIVLKRYEQAVKQYLTTYQKSESKKIKDEKRRILQGWGDLSSVRVYNRAFSGVIKEYIKTRNWLAAYKRIPAHLREMYVNAYQSFLWNECIKELLKKNVETKKLYSVEYAIGALLFYKNLTEQEKLRIPQSFLTMSDTALFTKGETEIVEPVLSKQGIRLTDLAIEVDTGNFLKSRARPVFLFPENFTITEPTQDEMNSKKNNQRYKIQVSFSLPKGSYATLITKRLFNH